MLLYKIQVLEVSSGVFADFTKEGERQGTSLHIPRHGMCCCRQRDCTLSVRDSGDYLYLSSKRSFSKV